MQVAKGKVVSIHYTLKNNGGDVLDSSDGREPLAYIQGSGHIIPGLEKSLEGKKAGDKLKAVINPEEAYGPKQETLIKQVALSDFQEKDEVKVGAQFQVQLPDGMQVVTITKVVNNDVTIDMNHPLAGVELHFDVKVENVRNATEEELAHGHIHGPGGHEH